MMIYSRRKRVSILVAGFLAATTITLTACPTPAQPVPTPSPTAPAASPTQTVEVPRVTPTVQRPAETPTPLAPQATPTSPAMQQTPTPGAAAGPTPTPKMSDCPKLESRLYRLTVAEDPAAVAANSGLHYVDGRVRVVVELQSLNDNLPAGYAVTIETRQGALIQALVPVRDLCPLSNEPQVRFVRAPAQPVR